MFTINDANDRCDGEKIYVNKKELKDLKSDYSGTITWYTNCLVEEQKRDKPLGTLDSIDIYLR